MFVELLGSLYEIGCDWFEDGLGVGDVLWMAAHVNGEWIDGHIDWVLKVVFGQHLIDFFVILEETFKFQTSLRRLICLVLENFTEASELGFIPELAECGTRYLYTDGNLSIFLDRYPSKLFSRSLAVI